MPASSPSVLVQLLVVERCEPALLMARLSVLQIEAALFGERSFIRGREGLVAGMSESLDPLRESAVASEALESWLRRKCRRNCRAGATAAA